MQRRARDAGIIIGHGTPGPYNAITDVPGVRVGYATLVDGDGPLVTGRGPVRTGVTVVVPHDGDLLDDSLYAGYHWLNGNGELTGTAWIRENGVLTSPIALTNTASVGVVRDALVGIGTGGRGGGEPGWQLPVVGETWDGVLNDIAGRHVRAEHVLRAYDSARGGPVAEGNVGGGTGMICHGFKAGTGTASRTVAIGDGRWTVGVLVQANHGVRERLTVLGVPVGEIVDGLVVPLPDVPEPSYVPGAGSVIVVIATDAPLLPHQCRRIAQRAGLAIARTGGVGEDDSGDGFLAFSTANRGLASGGGERPVTFRPAVLADAHINELFYAVVEATEEAIVNALLMAVTITGRDGVTAHALDESLLVDVLARYNRGPGAD